MKFTLQDIAILENLIPETGIISIKRKDEIIFQQKHFCTKDLEVIKETVDKLINVDLEHPYNKE